MNFAIAIEDLFWEEADDETEAIEQTRERLKNMNDEDIDELDLRVVDESNDPNI